MASLRDRLPQPAAPAAQGLLGEDWRFAPERLTSTHGFRLERESVHLLERPLALERFFHLRDVGDLRLTIGLRLHWGDGGEARASLLAFVESFERMLPLERVRRISDDNVGDFGLAWSWDDPLGAEVVAFTRANLLVTVTAPDGAGLAERVARVLDGSLAALRSIDRYPETSEGVFGALLREWGGERPRLAAGGRLPLGTQPGEERWFFLTTGGSANREPSAPDSWYFRAGLTPGRAEITLFRVDAGLLPVVERLALDVS
jgi:hypothetical protein